MHLQLKACRQHVGLRTQDFFHFRLEGLAKMAVKYGSKSKELDAAVKRVEHFIRQVTVLIFHHTYIRQLYTCISSDW